MKIKPLLLSLLMLPTSAFAWDVYTEIDNEGLTWAFADQMGEAGMILGLVCFQNKTHIEVEFPFTEGDIPDVAELFQVDGNPERLLAGFIEELDANTSLFIGIDRRDEPAVATEILLKEIAAGNYLYLGDPDRDGAIERWSLQGSSKAIRDMNAVCK